MSDVSGGPGWWQASDGKWYRPEQHPDYRPPPPPPPAPPPPPQATWQAPQPSPTFPPGAPFAPPGPWATPPARKASVYKRPMVLVGVVIVVALAVGLVVGLSATKSNHNANSTGGSSASGSAGNAGVKTHSVSGDLLLTDSSDAPFDNIPGQPCEGTGGYSDMSPGSSVTVKDGSGTIIASTTLPEGTTPGSDGTQCSFKFSVKLPETSFYSVEIGHRSALSYSLSQMKQQSWTISLTIGS